jgi:hypothetical protein
MDTGLAKKFMVEETASKFVFVGGDFLPLLRDNGVARRYTTMDTDAAHGRADHVVVGGCGNSL